MNNEIKLTEKEVMFCHEYCIDFNATQAAIRAGYSKKTAKEIGYQNLLRPNIQNKVKDVQAMLLNESKLSAIRVLKEHEKIAFSSITQFYKSWEELKDFDKIPEEQKSAIKSISTKIVKKNIGTKEKPEIVDIEFVKIELYDKQKSLDSISKLLGFEADQKLSIQGDINVKGVEQNVTQVIFKHYDGRYNKESE